MVLIGLAWSPKALAACVGVADHCFTLYAFIAPGPSSSLLVSSAGASATDQLDRSHGEARAYELLRRTPLGPFLCGSAQNVPHTETNGAVNTGNPMTMEGRVTDDSTEVCM